MSQEAVVNKRIQVTGNRTKLRTMVQIAMLSAVSAVLMMFEFPIPFLAPPFIKMDFSEIPVLVGTFAMGPVAGAVMEGVKILVKLLLKPTSTGFVGEFANIVIGCSMVVPAGMIYRLRKTKKGAIEAMAVGTILMATVGAMINALVMIPFYSRFMPLDNILEAGAAINPAVSSVWGLAIFCVAPFNLLKGVIVSLLTALVYKRISCMIHSADREICGDM